jgi:nascent polypeptide-associated complex subunit alpha
MFPGMNMDPRQMKMAMKKMGVTQEDLDAEQVIIKLADRTIIFDNPQVAKVNMMGQETYQIIGEARVEERNTAPTIEEEDINTVMEQTGASREATIEAINDANGDLAQAIINLKEDED